MNVKKVRNRSTLLLDANIVAGDVISVNSKSLDFDTAAEEDKQRGWSLVNSVYKTGVEETLSHRNDEQNDFKRSVQRRKRQLGDLKPWTVANRIRRLCQMTEKRVRTPEELLDLVALLQKCCPFIAAQSLEDQVKACKVCKVRSFKKDCVVLRQGEAAGAVYIVVVGRVGVMCQYRDWGDATGMSERVPRFQRSLAHGRVFGDLALRLNCARTASVFAESNCDLLLLEMEDYMRIFSTSMREAVESAAVCLKEVVHSFATLPMAAVRELAGSAAEVQFRAGQLFDMDGGRCVYFIKEGRCTLLLQNQRAGLSVELGTLSQGGLFGESCVFPDLQHGWLCRADSALTCFQIPKDRFGRADASVLAVIRDEAEFRNTYFLGRHGIKCSGETEPHSETSVLNRRSSRYDRSEALASVPATPQSIGETPLSRKERLNSFYDTESLPYT